MIWSEKEETFISFQYILKQNFFLWYYLNSTQLKNLFELNRLPCLSKFIDTKGPSIIHMDDP